MVPDKILERQKINSDFSPRQPTPWTHCSELHMLIELAEEI